MVCGTRRFAKNHCWSSTYVHLLQKLNWLTLSDRRVFLTCCQTFKIISGIDCICCEKYFSFKTRASRQHGMILNIPQSRVNASRYSYFINAPFIWNKLSAYIVEASSLKIFKSQLQASLLN